MSELFAAVVLLLGCGGSGAAPADAATTMDSASGDAAPPDARPPGDAGADAPVEPPEPDGAPRDAGPAGRCEGSEVELPAWVERAAGSVHRLLARGTSRDVWLEAFADAVVRLRYLPPGATPPDRSFALVVPATELAPAARLRVVAADADRVELCTEAFSITLAREGGRVTLRDAAGLTLVEDAASAGPGAPASEVVRHTPADELFYGLGEKTGPLDRRGRRMVFDNTDAYDPRYGGWHPDADPLYLSVPFFVGLRGDTAYGVFTDVAHRLEVDLAAPSPDRYRVASAGPSIDQYVFAGPAIAEVVRRYTALVGRAPLPPRWALGFHQSRWGYATAARVVEVAETLRGRDLPADALWLDIQHMRGFRTFTFDPGAFPDPEALAATLEASGFHLVVIADPGLKVDPGWDVYDTALAGGHLLRRPDGSVYVGAAWPGEAVFLDYTAPGARAFWGDQVAGLLARGIDGVWLDVNEPTVLPEGGGDERVPDDLPVAGDGLPTTMAEAHNVYALHQARATYEAMRAARPDRRPFVLSRAGYAGIQRWAAVWTGDAPSTWWSLRQALPMLLGMGLSGVPFVGSDVGGYSGGASAELYARWLELGAFSPFFRAHVTQGVPDQEPWAFGPEVEDISRHRLRERYRLMPYLVSLFDEAAATGAPPLRPLVWHHQDDPAVRRIDDQAMLGPFLMVAPVLEEGATSRRVHLPAGRWYDLESGAIWEGPADVELDVTLAAVPLLVREGAILPRVAPVHHAGEAPAGPLRLDLYPADEPSSFVLYDDAGEGFEHLREGGYTRLPLALRRTADGAELLVGARAGRRPLATRGLEAWVHRVDGEVSAVRVDGEPLPRFDDPAALALAGRGFFHDRADRALVVRLDGDLGARESLVELRYDPTITELRPAVEVTLEVRVPEGTPLDPPPHVASSADGWTMHHPLAWTDTPGVARGTISVPRGSWFLYKYTRGSWATVEKWAGCAEASNRYGLGAAHPDRHDVVAAWADLCP